MTAIAEAKSSASRGAMRPAGSGRRRVRRILASCSRSTYWFSAFVPAATSAVPTSMLTNRPTSIFFAANRYPAAVVTNTIRTMRALESSR